MKCPTCSKPVAKGGNRHYPFCCDRCQMADLGRWLGEEYRIPEPADAAKPPPDSGDE